MELIEIEKKGTVLYCMYYNERERENCRLVVDKQNLYLHTNTVEINNCEYIHVLK